MLEFPIMLDGQFSSLNMKYLNQSRDSFSVFSNKVNPFTPRFTLSLIKSSLHILQGMLKEITISLFSNEKKKD
jgi:hypothetical protein